MNQKSILSDKKAIVEHVTDFLFMVIIGVVFFLVLGVLLTRGVGTENPAAVGEAQTTAIMENLLYSHRINFEQGGSVDAALLQKQLRYVREQGGLPEVTITESIPSAGARMQK